MPRAAHKESVKESPPDAPLRRADTFRNEPHTDFSRRENRDAFQTALDDVAAQLGGEHPLVIDGKATETRKKIVSVNPSHKKQTVGTVASAAVEHAEQAIVAARRSYDAWRTTPADQRAEYLEVMAAEMRNRRFELSAWEVYECGKPWADADADVAEAIDFLTFYAQQMRDLAVPMQVDYPGEENTHSYRPRGVAVIIAPWNFPLAILTGMTAAALVAGNTVIMKPAEQSSVVAAQLMSIARDAGLPRGVLNYLPGIGEEIGPALVGSPDVDVIAFTGSRNVGLAINKLGADTDPRQSGVKRIIAEMGGKNAIIVDEDADLDEAVQGVLHSAFGYSGQKCSACSRVIVH
ncbi:MAG: aldehyde dehydrogenase family protein, partial [Pirellulales bacterium]